MALSQPNSFSQFLFGGKLASLHAPPPAPSPADGAQDVRVLRPVRTGQVAGGRLDFGRPIFLADTQRDQNADRVIAFVFNQPERFAANGSGLLTRSGGVNAGSTGPAFRYFAVVLRDSPQAPDLAGQKLLSKGPASDDVQKSHVDHSVAPRCAKRWRARSHGSILSGNYPPNRITSG